MSLEINRQNLTAFFTVLNAAFQKGFKDGKSTWDQIATLVPSTGEAEDYSWINQWPDLIEWIGEKTLHRLRACKYVVENKDFEATVTVKRNKIKDGKLAGMANWAEGAGKSAKRWPDKLVYGGLLRVFADAGYDGQYQCDTDHPVELADGSVITVSNKTDKRLSRDNLARAEASYGAAKREMQLFMADGGIELDIKPNLLICGPKAEATAKMLMNSDKLADGSSNPYKGDYTVLVSSKIRDDSWYLTDTTQPVQCMIFQEREKPNLVSQTDMSADDVFNRAEYKYGVEARGNFGFGPWQLIYGSTGTNNAF